MNWIGREPTVFTGVLECYLWLEGVDEGYLCKNHDSQIDSRNPSHLTNRLLIPYLILYFRPNRCGSFCSLFKHPFWLQRAHEKVIIPSQRQQLPNLSSASFSLHSRPSAFSPHLHNPREMDLFSSHPQRLPVSAIIAATFVFNCRSKDVIVIVPGDSEHYHCFLPISATTCLSWSFILHPFSYCTWSFGLQQSVSVLVIWLVCGFVNFIPVEIIKSDK